jgi:response regulator of citrate/malate metabolism
MSGLDVCRGIRGRTDVIAVTAADDVDTVRAAVSHGVVQYLIKPFSFATFADKLERYAAFRRASAGHGRASQDEIDRMLGTLRGSAGARPPKGLSRDTLELITKTVEDAGRELSAVEVGDAAGLSRVTARRYLEHLAGEGRVTLSKRYGGAGRPEHRYGPVRDHNAT